MIRTSAKRADLQEGASGCHTRIDLFRINVLRSGAIACDHHHHERRSLADLPAVSLEQPPETLRF